MFSFFRNKDIILSNTEALTGCLHELADLLEKNNIPSANVVRKLLSFPLPEKQNDFIHHLNASAMWDGRDAVCYADDFNSKKDERAFETLIIRLAALMKETGIKNRLAESIARKFSGLHNQFPCPVKEQTRIRIEEAMTQLTALFGTEALLSKRVLIPDPEDFNILFDGSEKSIQKTLQIVAKQMDLNPADIKLDIYRERIKELNSGGPMNSPIYLNVEAGQKSSAGLYWGKLEDGKYHIAVEYNSLRDPEKLVAVLAHELSHVKLLGENRTDKNDEFLTDLTCVFFGLGVFNANAAFNYIVTFEARGYNNMGYLSQMAWGYALALHAFIRKEEEPGWLEYLNPNVRSDFKMSMEFIQHNQGLIFETKS